MNNERGESDWGCLAVVLAFAVLVLLPHIIHWLEANS